MRLAGTGIVLAIVLGLSQVATAADVPAKKPGAPQEAPELADHSPPERAVVTKVQPVSPDRAGQSGYLGVSVKSEGGKLVVSDVQLDSPADKAGVRRGDVVARLNGQPVTRADVFREMLQVRSPGEKITLHVNRDGKPLEFMAALTSVSRPMRLGVERLAFGAQVADAKDGEEGTLVERIQPNSPAAEAGLRTGDVILKLDGNVLRRATQIADALAERRAGDTLNLVVRREGKEIESKVKLTADRSGGFGFRGGSGGNFAGPPPTAIWTKNVYRLAVIPVEFSDTKHNAKLSLKDWEAALFHRGVTTKQNASGQKSVGSLNDYFQEQSYGTFRVEGKVFNWVEVSKKRGDYSQGTGTSNRGALPNEALDKVAARDGKEALKEFDGVFFIYAGSRIATNRGAVYHPHAGTVRHQGRVVPYLLCYEGGERIAPLSAFCREFAFLLGLPDLAARTENAGSEGVGVWCMLGGPQEERPQGMSAWAKEQLGWLRPAVIDPTVKQKLVLSSVTSAPSQCVKVLVKPDGSEYFLLENRRKMGADSALPGQGLLIWRVVNQRPLLEESHGIEGPAGPRSLPEMVPYPSKANTSFTPLTMPTSRSARGGGLPVWITEIRQHADGRVSFHVGYDYQ